MDKPFITPVRDNKIIHENQSVGLSIDSEVSNGVNTDLLYSRCWIELTVLTWCVLKIRNLTI